MDQENMPMEENEGYQPRPKWQRVGALAGVVILLVAFLLYCYQIAMGGI